MEARYDRTANPVCAAVRKHGVSRCSGSSDPSIAEVPAREAPEVGNGHARTEMAKAINAFAERELA